MKPAAFDRRAIPEGAREYLWTAPDGQGIRRMDWPAPDENTYLRGSMLFMPGRGDSYEKYLESFEDWRRRGWQVSAGCWRGQAGSGRLASDEVTGHIEDFGQWVADLAAFWRAWAADNPAPRVLVGHSMGGHLTLRAVAERALDPMPDALVLSAPLLGVHPEFMPHSLQSVLARVMTTIADPRRPAWKWSEKPGEIPRFRMGLLTHDEARYADERWWRDERPELVMGPGSWGWVRAVLDSIRALDSEEALKGIDIPVFIFGTDADKLVSTSAIRRAARFIPTAELLMFGDEAAHEILREVDPVRDKALAAIAEFLERVLPV